MGRMDLSTVGAGGFVDEQSRRRRRSAVLLVGTFMLLWVAANAVAFPAHLTSGCTAGGPAETCTTRFAFNPLALAVTAAGVTVYLLIAYRASARAALALTGARPAGPEQRQLANVVEEMALAAGVPTPSVWVIDDPAPNAFAAGRNPEHAAVAVTTGLLATMSRSELQGVVAHEIAHIANRDTTITTLAVLSTAAVAVLADLAWRIGFWSGMGRRRNNDSAFYLLVVAAALYVVVLPAALLLRAGLSRNREALADATAVDYTRYPSGLRSALEKLEADTTVVRRTTAATAHLWIESPLERGNRPGGAVGRLMNTHPPLADRIALLRAYEGLDPHGRGPVDPIPSRAIADAPATTQTPRRSPPPGWGAPDQGASGWPPPRPPA